LSQFISLYVRRRCVCMCNCTNNKHTINRRFARCPLRFLRRSHREMRKCSPIARWGKIANNRPLGETIKNKFIAAKAELSGIEILRALCLRRWCMVMTNRVTLTHWNFSPLLFIPDRSAQIFIQSPAAAGGKHRRAKGVYSIVQIYLIMCFIPMRMRVCFLMPLIYFASDATPILSGFYLLLTVSH